MRLRSSDRMVFPGNARALPQAGRSRDYKEGPTSSALCEEGRPFPGPHPRGDSHHGPLYGWGGEQSWYGTGVHQNLNLAGINGNSSRMGKETPCASGGRNCPGQPRTLSRCMAIL